MAVVEANHIVRFTLQNPLILAGLSGSGTYPFIVPINWGHFRIQETAHALIASSPGYLTPGVPAFIGGALLVPDAQGIYTVPSPGVTLTVLHDWINPSASDVAAGVYQVTLTLATVTSPIH